MFMTNAPKHISKEQLETTYFHFSLSNIYITVSFWRFMHKRAVLKHNIFNRSLLWVAAPFFLFFFVTAALSHANANDKRKPSGEENSLNKSLPILTVK